MIWTDVKIPPAAFLVLPPGVACGQVPDESWIVNPKNRGLKDAFVWLEDPVRGVPLPIHPKHVKPNRKTSTLDQIACRFEPHVLALRQGDVLLAKNSSLALADVQFTGNPQINPQRRVNLPPLGQVAINGLNADRFPIRAESSNRPWMSAWIRVFDHPYYAITDAEGKFTLSDAPAGGYRIKIWHPTGGWLGGAAGRNGIPIVIAAGKNTPEPFEYPAP